MYFTNGDYRAFESLMRDKPGDQYDSGADGPYPECRSCRCHRPFWTYRKSRRLLYGRVIGCANPFHDETNKGGLPI